MPLPSLPTPGSLGGYSALDGPPPSPATETGMSPGTSPALGSLVPPIPSHGLPPQMLQGMMSAGQSMIEMLDSFAQAAPDVSQQVAITKEALMTLLATLAQAGAPPTSPQAPGPGFPGGGFDRGGMPLA